MRSSLRKVARHLNQPILHARVSQALDRPSAIDARGKVDGSAPLSARQTKRLDRLVGESEPLNALEIGRPRIVVRYPLRRVVLLGEHVAQNLRCGDVDALLIARTKSSHF